MVIGIGGNKANGRRSILITLNENDVMQLVAAGFELNAETMHGFPDDLEVCLAVADDGYATTLALTHNPEATQFPQPPKQQSRPRES